MRSFGRRPVWTEYQQLCIILQMEHNTAFVDMMSSLGKITLQRISTEQSYCANYLSL